MIDPVAMSELSAAQMGSGKSMPSQANVDAFTQMLEQPNVVDKSLRTFIESAQSRLNTQRVDMDMKLRDFNARDNVFSLIDAMHTSSMHSVHVQLTGKIGTKVSEHFEQLIKQQ
ncbi:MAG TPA: hypothetical protein VFV39_01905 [Limnobacter sp.]|nr:hypothetical protein [Limnobacter sp.]